MRRSCAATLLLLAAVPIFCAPQQGASVGQQAADVRRELYAVDYRHYRDLDDYLSRCEQVRVLIPTMESFYKWSDAELERLRIKHSDNPQLLELADFYLTLNTEDKAGLRVLKEEMDLARAMTKMPLVKRHAFFEQQIRPLQQKEDQLSAHEVEMAREAVKRGLALPPWLRESLSNAN